MREKRTNMSAATPNFRVGIGYDVHQLVTGRALILGGVEIPHSHGLDGHSDADVLSHAIADAVLGALGEPDIGYYFPPTDESIKGISSLDILKKIRAVADERGAVICNIDSTLIAEAPKILPHAAEMKQNIARALGIEVGQVGIKATTNETMGFAGRREGMAAHAVAAVSLA
jgi:2-C-methyl-D-erythritol 2,4-cyclodiphosphate synthase